MLLRDAIQGYHDLLSDDLAAASQARLDDQLRLRGLFFGERALCTVLRPRLITIEQYRFLQTRVQALLRAFDTALQAALEQETIRAQFCLNDWEQELVQFNPGFRAASPTSRIDTFFVTEHGGLRLTEYNAETPAAQAYNDALSEVFYALPVMREYLRRFEVRALPARHSLLHVLLDAFQQWSGNGEPPQIAILDWREVPTYSEFVLFEQYFKSQGLNCIIADPREAEYRNGRLYFGETPITLVYKRVLLSELVERGGIDHPVIRAVRDGAVCMVNPFRCKILHKKASLAVLSDERNEHLFSSTERQAIANHIPWTRRVEERHTLYRDQTVDLIPFILEHRERFVLKANDEYGGKGIILGWETDAERWVQALQTALSEPFVVQERVAVPNEGYPVLVDGQVQISDRIMDTAPFAWYGDYIDGCLTRLSTDALVNVTAGGGSTVPTFLVDKR
jgi:uncharacterized circularly permuted ATP-grasp superfamily protein